MIVMALIASLGGLFIANYPASRNRARDTQRINDLRQYQTAMEIYANSNEGTFPITTDTEMPDVCNSALTAYVSDCPSGPTDDTVYNYVGSATSYLLYTELEATDDSGSTQYQYFCSTGESGITTTDPGTTSPC